MKRTDIIQLLIDKIKAKSYLEIGMGPGRNFKEIECSHKIAVDPQPFNNIVPVTHTLSSDDFFSQNQEKFDSNKLFFLLETHSEHLLLRFMRRIRETSEGEVPEKMALTPDKISIYYIESTEGRARATKLEVSENGDSANKWPDGFFEERDEELF